MDLWIRSQDKTELVKVDRLYLKEHNGKLYIYSQNNNVNKDDIILGVYKSGRTFEVLNEIQEYLIREDYNYNDKNKNSVYEMPLE